MANTKSAKTKVRVIERKTAINKAVRNRYRTYIKKTELDIVNNSKSEAQASMKVAEAEIMSAVSKGILHRNTAARKVSRLIKKVKAIN
ncbi:30S ribosomal protein S20 [Pelagibacteraceae bacterium]|jgi:small subunit ribosomal protein S20|nr:30S ribosomal protein S20 [Pelagibacteraceae bacterium]|tara:strand:- start:2162 stop:2425 length:264 start_codon:yes stop_codon:yes gene_type:complete